MVLSAAAMTLALMAAPEGVLSHPHPGRPISVVLNAPSGRPGVVARSEILAKISSLLRDKTDFEMQELDASVVKSCRGRLMCMVLQVRTDYDRQDPSGAPPVRGDPEFLVFITHLTDEEMTERLSVLLVDTTAALELYHDADRSQEGWEAIVEGEIATSGVQERAAEIRGATDADEVLLQAVMQDFRPVFDKSGHWQPFGELEIVTEVEGAGVRIGDVLVGVTKAGSTKVVKVPRGPQKVAVEHSEYLAYSADVNVQRGGTARVEAALVARGSPVNSVVRWAAIGAGAVATAVGAGILAFGIERQAGGHPRAGYCLHTSDVECPGSPTFVRFGAGQQGAFQTGNGSGPPIAPLGYSLMGMGLSWLLGPLLIGEENRLPWIDILVGVGVFALSFGISVAADGTEPVCAVSDEC